LIRTFDSPASPSPPASAHIPAAALHKVLSFSHADPAADHAHIPQTFSLANARSRVEQGGDEADGISGRNDSAVDAAAAAIIDAAAAVAAANARVEGSTTAALEDAQGEGN
jgi:hypothetical protein